MGLSVSRVGSAAQTKAMKKVAGKMRLELAQFRELAAFVQFSSDLDPDTKKKIARGELLTEILKQADLEPAPFEKAVVILYAALSGAMDNIPIPEAQSYASGLLDWLEKLHRDEILGAIRKSSDFTDEVEEKLKAAIKDYGISAKS
ncbi:MAG: ATP synthase subunit alpha [Candidatus Giovannonibacteria bacterium GW2011_GWC2_44_8]|uniref:ATP synthase subunit alpha n=1 Tax=Candidatus Giovannonibacteria bacterium GW2011_GWC2_44_8 TaxID=1618657 RepID=A0A0G1M7K7_9BACT|nr:MAG: ATP synthase subunit alpha [Candidatus Giovannonibacteria bacterium GW2011_GWC2_44_8]